MKIHEILEKTVPGMGFELVDVEISPGKIVCLFIDKPGGVTVDDCELVSNHLTKLFLVEEIDYNRLEVSSPGVERPLKKIEDFTRFLGQTVKVKLRELVDNQKVFQGQISMVDGNKITLLLDQGQLFEFNFSNLLKARLIYDFRADLKLHKNH